MSDTIATAEALDERLRLLTNQLALITARYANNRSEPLDFLVTTVVKPGLLELDADLGKLMTDLGIAPPSRDLAEEISTMIGTGIGSLTDNVADVVSKWRQRLKDKL